MNKTQEKVIKCAYADLCGALQARNQGDVEVHDWKAHRESIYELERAFADLVEPVDSFQ